MGGVAVIGTQQQGVGAGADALLFRHAQALLNAGEHVCKQGAAGPLTAGGTDFLVIKHDPDIAAALFLAAALQKAPQGGVGALQVVDAARHEILAVQAQTLGFLPGAEDDVGVHDLFGLDTGFPRQHSPQAAACRAEDGLQIDLGVILHAVVQVTVEVDAEVGDAGHGAVRVDQTALNAAFRLHQHAAGHAQGAVQPGGHDHAAVTLGLRLGKHFILGAVQFLDPPGGRIAVAGRRVPAGQRALGHPPCHDGRAVAGGIIFASRSQLPGSTLRAVLVAVLFEDGCRRRGGVERADAGVQEVEQAVDGKFVVHTMLLGFISVGFLLDSRSVPIITASALKVNRS